MDLYMDVTEDIARGAMTPLSSLDIARESIQTRSSIHCLRTKIIGVQYLTGYF